MGDNTHHVVSITELFAKQQRDWHNDVLALLTSHINRRASFFFCLLWLLPRVTPSAVYIC